MNSHHFYGTNRATGKGGLNIDENSINPNADYWKNSANAALVRLMAIVGDDKARELTDELTGTWKEIRDAITAIEAQEIKAEQRRQAAEMKQMERDNFVSTGIELDGAETGISQPVIF